MVGGRIENYAVSNYGNENLPGNLNPQVAPEPPLRAAPRAALGELPLPQPQPQQQQAGPTKKPPLEQTSSLKCVRVAEYHDSSIDRWTSSGPGHMHEALTDRFLNLRFARDTKRTLPRTYAEFERRYEELRSLALEWVEIFFTPEPVMPRMTGLEVRNFGKENPLLVSWIDNVASAHGLCWMDLLHEKRHLIAMGVLGRVLEDRVFKSEFFGAGPKERKLLQAIDREGERREVSDLKIQNWDLLSDAFARQKPRAAYINESLKEHELLPKSFAVEVEHLFSQLDVLLRPLLFTTKNKKQFPNEKYLESLNWIVAVAGKLSLDMRREPDTVYYVATTPPRHKGLDFDKMSPVIFKEEEWDYIATYYEDFTNVISVWPGLIAYRRLSARSVSVRIICQALIFGSFIKDERIPHGTESNPEKTCNEPQFWQYLKFLGAPITGDRRAPYS